MDLLRGFRNLVNGSTMRTASLHAVRANVRDGELLKVACP